jgi:hypothetical protein
MWDYDTPRKMREETTKIKALPLLDDPFNLRTDGGRRG